MKPLKKDKDGQDLQESIHLNFEDRFFGTNEDEEAEFIRKCRNFNTEYFELDPNDKLPKGVGVRDNQVEIRKMDTRGEQNNKSAEIDTLKQQVDNLTSIVGQLVEKLTDNKKTKKEEGKKVGNKQAGKTSEVKE